MVLTENNPSLNTCSSMWTALRVHFHILTICCVQSLSKMLMIYFGKRLLHAYAYLFMFPKLWPSHDVWGTFHAWICCWVPCLPCYFKSWSSFTKRYCRLLEKEASFRCPTRYNWKRTINNQEVRTSGCPAAAPTCPAITAEGEEPWNRECSQRQPDAALSSQAVPCRAPRPRAEREPSTASIRVTQLLNKLRIKERKEFCLHDNGRHVLILVNPCWPLLISPSPGQGEGLVPGYTPRPVPSTHQSPQGLFTLVTLSSSPSLLTLERWHMC